MFLPLIIENFGWITEHIVKRTNSGKSENSHKPVTNIRENKRFEIFCDHKLGILFVPKFAHDGNFCCPIQTIKFVILTGLMFIKWFSPFTLEIQGRNNSNTDWFLSQQIRNHATGHGINKLINYLFPTFLSHHTIKRYTLCVGRLGPKNATSNKKIRAWNFGIFGFDEWHHNIITIKDRTAQFQCHLEIHWSNN